MTSNFSTVLKPTSKIVLNLSMDLILKLSKIENLRPVQWPLTFIQFKANLMASFWPQHPDKTSTFQKKANLNFFLNFSPWTSYLTCPRQSCKLHAMFSTVSLKFCVKAASFGKYLEPQEINAGFSAQN